MRAIRPLSERQKLRLQVQLNIISEELPDGGSFLDLGTEYGHTGRTVRAVFPVAEIEGVEVHHETFLLCAEESKKYDIYNALYQVDALDFMRDTKKQWDVIVCAELIEHLTKEQGEELVGLMKERGETVIVTSPLGFMRQGAIHGNPHQRHVSGWDSGELVALGFEIHSLYQKMSLGIYVYRG